MHNFSTGKRIAYALAVIGWWVFLVALIVASVMLLMGTPVAVVLAVWPALLSGLCLVLGSALAQAQFATAEGIWHLVKLTETAQSGSRSGRVTPGLPQASRDFGDAPDMGAHPASEMYRGVQIVLKEGQYLAHGQRFTSFDNAKAHVDRLAT